MALTLKDSYRNILSSRKTSSASKETSSSSKKSLKIERC